MSEKRVANLYFRGRYWWVRARINGRYHRRSTGAADLVEAVAFRDRYIAKLQRMGSADRWQAWIDEDLAQAAGHIRLLHSRIRRRSRIKAWGEVLALEELAAILRRSNGTCEVSGLPMESPNRKRNPMGASVDRIDCTKGYTVDNCRVVVLALNIAMSTWGEDIVRRLARSLVAQELISGAIQAHQNSADARNERKALKNMVEREGLEPSTPAL